RFAAGDIKPEFRDSTASANCRSCPDRTLRATFEEGAARCVDLTIDRISCLVRCRHEQVTPPYCREDNTRWSVAIMRGSSQQSDGIRTAPCARMQRPGN